MANVTKRVIEVLSPANTHAHPTRVENGFVFQCSQGSEKYLFNNKLSLRHFEINTKFEGYDCYIVSVDTLLKPNGTVTLQCYQRMNIKRKMNKIRKRRMKRRNQEPFQAGAMVNLKIENLHFILVVTKQRTLSSIRPLLNTACIESFISVNHDYKVHNSIYNVILCLERELYGFDLPTRSSERRTPHSRIH